MLPLPLFTFRNFFAANLVTAFVYGVLMLGTNSSIADAASLAVASCGPGPSQLGALRRSRRTREACTAKATDDPAA